LLLSIHIIGEKTEKFKPDLARNQLEFHRFGGSDNIPADVGKARLNEPLLVGHKENGHTESEGIWQGRPGDKSCP
jgi:hypothetical protein